MQEPLYRIGLVHGAHPSTETRICQAIAKPADGIAHNKGRIWRVSGENGKRDEMAYRRHDGHASLTKPNMNTGIGKSGDRVTDEWSEEDEGYDCVTKVIVLFELSG